MSGSPAISGGADRISELPDALIHSILSLVPLDTAATTVVLSKRWLHLFHSIPDLHFSSQSFSLHGSITKVAFFSANWILSDTDILRSPPPSLSRNPWVGAAIDILRARSHPVRNSSIRFSYGRDFKAEFDGIVLALCQLGVRELALENSRREELYEIPSCVLSCQTLRRLKAKSCWLMLPPDNTAGLRHLRSLDLEGVTTTDGQIELMVSSCLALEELSIRRCHGIHNVVIRSNTLSLLEIFEYRRPFVVPVQITIADAPCLSVGRIGFYDLKDWDEDDEVEEEEEDVVNLVNRLVGFLEASAGLEELCLSFEDAYAALLIDDEVSLPKALPSGNKLLKLKKLYLSMPFNDGHMLAILSFLLCSSPNVEKLFIHEFGVVHTSAMAEEEYWNEWKPLECMANWPATTTLHVRSTQLGNWVGFVRFLLMNACTLKKLIIAYNSQWEANAKQISKFEAVKKELLLLQEVYPDVVLELISTPCCPKFF